MFLKPFIRILLVLMPLFLGIDALATPCFIVSGARRDHNGAFSHPLFNKGTSILGEKCRVFDSWDLLRKYLEANKSVFPKDTQIMITQGAHGSKGGSASCNRGGVGGDAILNHLEELSQTYHVAAFIDSCYSGDLIRKKLLRDLDKKEDDPGLSRLCLAATSYFGRSSWGDDIATVMETQLKENEDAESIFQKFSTLSGSGLILSAEWEQTGITKYFATQELEQALQAMIEIKGLIDHQSQKCSVGEFDSALKSVSFCTHPLLSSKDFLNPPLIFQPATLESQIQRNREMIENFKKAGSPDCTNCLENFNHELSNLVSKHKDNVSLSDTLELITTYKSSPHYRDQCLKCQEGNFQVAQKQREDRIKSGLASPEELGFYQQNPIQKIDMIDPMAVGLLLDVPMSMGGPLPSVLSESMKKRAAESITMSRLLKQEIDRNKISEHSANKAGILRSVFGEALLAEETDPETGARMDYSTCTFISKPISSAQILNGFIRASLKDQYKNKKDDARRQACRSFKLKPGKPQVAPDFHSAVSLGLTEQIKERIEKGENVDVKDKNGKSPLDVAIDLRLNDVIELLISSGAHSSGHVTLTDLTDREDKKILKHLLDHGADINHVDEKGSFLLFEAVGYDDVEFVQFLLGYDKTNINQPNKYKLTPICAAAIKNNIPIFKLLLEDKRQIADLGKVPCGSESLLDLVQEGEVSEEIEKLIKEHQARHSN